VFKGEAKGLKDGGIIEQILWDLEVEGLPLDIPEKIEIDVSELVVGHSIHVAEVKVSTNVRVVTSGADTVVTMVKHIEEVIEAAATTTPEGAPIEPEVIKEKKEEPASEEGEADKKGAPKAADKKAPEKAAKPEKPAKPEKK
jgi:large subunit ribosomal protein L25